MAFSLTSIDPTVLPEDGGYLLEITGTFELSHQYRVYIGITGTSADAPCYSGKPDQGNVVYPYTASILRVYSPVLTLGTEHEILVVDVGTAEENTLSGVLTVVYRDLKSLVYSLRKTLPIFYKTGPRDVARVPVGVGDYVAPFSDPEASWWVFGGSPDALELPGTDPDAAIFDPQLQNDDFTVAGVYNPDGIVGNLGVFSKWISTDFNRCWMIQQWGNDLEFYITSTGAIGTISLASAVNSLVAGVDTFFCGRYEYKTPGTSEMFMRCNDITGSNLTAQGPVHSSTNSPVHIARTEGTYCPGDYYWFACWNRKLTDAEVQDLRDGTVLPQELDPDYYEDFHDAVTSENDSEMPLVSPITFDVQGSPTHGGSSESSVKEENTRILDTVGLIEGITGVVGDEHSEIGGLRMTRTTAVINATDTTFLVETTNEWPDTGKVALDGVVYYYTGKTATTFTGITHIAAGASVAGARIQHRVDSTVTDLSREYNALDLLRRGFLVNYAEGDDLSALGRNLGVDRLPIFRDDDEFRAVIKALAYSPRGTMLSLELALESFLGAGNFEVYEDLILYPNTVFIRIDPSVFVEEGSFGKAFFNPVEWDQLAGGQDTLVLSRTPLDVGSVILKDLEELFNFEQAKPSALTYEYWPGETPASAFTYAGAESEATQVTVITGTGVELVSGAGGTVFYEMLDTQGARIAADSYTEVSALLMIPTGAVIGTDKNQTSISIKDGAFEVNVGVDGTGVGLFASTGGGFLGNTLATSLDVWYEITVKKFGIDHAELWIDGNLISSVLYSLFTVATADHQVEWGIRGVPLAGMKVQVRQIGFEIKTTTDYWVARGVAGSVATANPTRFNDNIALLGSGDADKDLIITGSVASNPQGGNNNGRFYIWTYVSSGVAEVQGRLQSEAATVETANPTRITVEDEEGFTYPDDLGKQIIIYGSSVGNDGIYVIDTLLEPGTLADFASYDTPIIGARTNICEVVAATFVSEVDLTYQLRPVFVTEAGLDWVLSDASSFSGDTLTLRQGLWANNLVMETRYSDVLTAQLLKNTEVENEIYDIGPPVLYEYYPFYLSDFMGLIRAFVDTITAAGVIPEFEIL